MKLIIQMPAFNEEATITQALRELPRKLEGITSIETLVIDDGSSDGTVEAAKRAGASHIIQLRTHRGLSAAFAAGIDAALRLGADIIVNTDADNQYVAADIARLIAPIVRGTAEVVIGDRQVGTSPHMSPLKRSLQRMGSWTVSLASGVRVGDVTSGFRAFSREAAMQINVFNPFTYTLETVIQAGNRNLGVQSVTVRTNPPTRPSRLYSGVGTYVRKSAATIFRVYALYRPLKTFFAIGSVLMFLGLLLGGRFLWYFLQGDRAGRIQSLILAAVFLITGFHTWLIALLADLIAVNRRLSEDVLIRVRRLESPVVVKSVQRAGTLPHQRLARPERTPRRGSPAGVSPSKEAATPATQWVWLLDEEKLKNRVGPEVEKKSVARESQPEIEAEPAEDSQGTAPRRRRRRRGGVRQATELPGNRGRHLANGDEPSE
jgi:glycosyltransferase involved in cell wall biosynthesis